MNETRVDSADTSLDESMVTWYQGAPFTGEAVAHAANGNMISLVTYKHGIEHGPQAAWYPDGTKQLEGQCDRGEPVGEWRNWHPSGQLSRYTLFSGTGDKLKVQSWDESGELIEDKTF
ncbi:MORN repeat variant [Saccharopolyspora kobensis]|uniref:MORN repeat variant n=1 Tax=Saccharopolyspora kobensis TaxID=146035 RepID=A0A1H6EE55_9PSEU|nr:hypothetical protein [Saccharopolyspora kobensis]SEG96098.1 MORN repeat variant [Saccharopolyspora kobensis]SFD22254.1 MORN repeat variant [Saccharopolyspora kobensis]